jgi:hypothetical protein
VLIVDLDAHHGDGNAVVFLDDPSVRILDFYEADNFPYSKLPVWRKVEFGPGVRDAEYLEVLARELPLALEDSGPDLVVYVAGVDVYEHDPLTRFELTREGILARDAYLFDEVRRSGIPIAMVLAGGYAAGVWEIQYESIRRARENPGDSRVRPLVLRRFRRLCKFLADHGDVFRMRTFSDPDVASYADTPAAAPLRSPLHRTLRRMAEQVIGLGF